MTSRRDPSTVGLASIDDRDPSDGDILAIVRTALEPLGGVDAFVGSGDHVLLKPNQTLWRLATDGVTTDPRVAAALTTLAREAGAGRISVADASGGDLRTQQVLETNGMRRLCLGAGADEVVGFEDGPHRDVTLHAADRQWKVPVPELVLDADVIINVPKAKTHFEDPISGAMKNWVGVIGQAGRPKVMDDAVLFDVVAALHEAVPAALHVMDGLWVGQGDGPAANDPTWLGCVVAGTDPVSVDVTTARLMGLDPAMLRMAAAGRGRGLGPENLEEIRVEGPPVDRVRIAVTPARRGVDHLPVRVLAGDGVTWAGSLGHFKSIADVFDKYGLWTVIEKAHGRPTFMIGEADDPRFEEHLKDGPYFVIDDVAHARYREHPDVTFIPGSPATHNIFPYLFRRLRVEAAGPKGMDAMRVMKKLEAYFHFRSWKGERPAAASR